MIQKVFGVRDSKAVAFLQPFFSSAIGSALRAFGDAVNDGKSPLAQHPEDYILYEIGSFNDSTGELVAVVPMKMLGCGADFVTNRVPQTLPVRNQDITTEMLVEEVVANGSQKAG